MHRRHALRALQAIALAGAMIFGLSPLATAATAGPAGAGRLVYFGTHGDAIIAARFNEKTGRLTGLGVAAQIARPTWLTPSFRSGVLYAVSETGNDGKSEASVYALSVDPASGKLRTIDTVRSGGGGATHLDLDPRSRTLFVANFGTGQASALPVHADGAVDAPTSVVQDQGTGPKPRQSSPHAHSVVLDPTGRFLLVADLGADRVFVYRFDPEKRQLTPNDPAFAAAPAGSGPRHIAFLPNGRFAYVNSELTGDLTLYRWDATKGRLEQAQILSTYSAQYQGEKSAAEIAVSRDGRFLYVSNRGEDSLVVYRTDAATGRLSEVQRIASGGKTPWSFTVDPTERWLLVADEASSLVSVFRRDPATGRLIATGESLAAPRPVSIAFPKS